MKYTIVTLSVPWDDEGDEFVKAEDHPSTWDWTDLIDAPDTVRVLSWEEAQ
jgi:hypothetical protein